MPALSDYTAGTITLTNNSTAFTGTGTGWMAAGFREGDTIFQVAGQTQWTAVVATITSNTAGTLVRPWGGATGTYQYRMRYMADGARVTAQARNLIELLGNGNLEAEAGLTGAANTLSYYTGPAAKALAPLTPYARTLLDDANATAMQSTLGLTPGLVGANAPVPSAAGNGMADGDFDTLTAYGVYTIAGSWANGPSGTATYTGVCIVLRRSFNQVLQVLYLTNGYVGSRGNNSGAWSRSVDTSWFDPTNIPNSQLASMATARIKGRVSSGTGVVEDLTAAQVRTFLGMAQSTGDNGYVTLPGGVMIQWGVVPFGSPASPSVVFPTAFPSAVRSIAATIMDSGATATNTAFSVAVSSQTTSGFVAQRRYTQGTSVAGAGEAFRWIAVGN